MDVEEAYCANCKRFVDYKIVDTELNVIREVKNPLVMNLERHSTAEVVEFYCVRCKTLLARFKGHEVKEFKLV
jgi:hypothetical protein